MMNSEMSVKLLDTMGDDVSIVNAARVSFDKESSWDIIGLKEFYDDYGNVCEQHPIKKLGDKDVKLLRYLSEHNHWSPFAHASASFRIKAPIFVARQLAKHQVGFSWNEVSRRYVSSSPEFYFPNGWRKAAENVKQGSADVYVQYEDGWAKSAKEVAEQCVAWYNAAIEAGMCAEQARMMLPQNMMTEWVWTGSVYGFARMCNLRLDEHTQRETQHIAAIVSVKMAEKFPNSWKVLMKEDI